MHRDKDQKAVNKRAPPSMHANRNYEILWKGQSEKSKGMPSPMKG